MQNTVVNLLDNLAGLLGPLSPPAAEQAARQAARPARGSAPHPRRSRRSARHPAARAAGRRATRRTARAADAARSVSVLQLEDLAQFTRGEGFASDYPPNVRILLSPRHDGHAALVHLLGAAETSLVGGMYGFDDNTIGPIYVAKAQQPNFLAMLSLDRSQAGGVHEREILAKMHADNAGTSVAVGDVTDAVMRTVAVGTSSVKSAISHLKQWVIDGRYVLDGSMNESTSGEEWQNNSLVVIDDRVVAAQVQANLLLVHTEMLKQMAARAGAGSPG
ncbi:MAG: phospholipase D-like domain-containing protein [Actinobacteria bacterium]|nr:phospholipase D-like domain-containing protein [Actinomycetota bacterium]